MISKRDLQLGKIALRAGMITKDDLTRALALQKKLVKTKGKKVALGALLLKKGYITQEQLEEIVKLHNEKAGAETSGETSGVTSAIASAEASGEASGEEPVKEKKKTKRAAAADEAPAATATRGSSRRAKTDAPAADDDDAARKKKERRASRAEQEASKNGGAGRSSRLDAAAAEGATSKRSKRVGASSKAEKPERADDEEAPKKEAKRGKPERRPSASDSEVDPAIFQSAPEDAVDEDDRRLIACPECGKKYRVRQAQVGKRFGCRRCKSKVKVPKDLFSRPVEAEGGKGGGVEVEEFTLGSSDMTDSGSSDGDEAATPPKATVRTAAAKAAVAIQRVQAGPSIAELAKAAQVAQKKGLPPRTRFGPKQAVTLAACVLALVGIVGGVVVVKNRAAEAEAAAAKARVDKEFDAWKATLDGVLARVEPTLKQGSAIDIGTLLTELGHASKEKTSLIQGDNRTRADAYEEQQGLPGKTVELLLQKARKLVEERGPAGADEAREIYKEVVKRRPDDPALRLLYARKLIEARRVAECAALLEPLAAASPQAMALRGYALERGDAGTKAAKAYAELQDPLAPVLAGRANIVDRAYDRALEALGKAAGLEGQAAAAAKVVEAQALELKGDPGAAERTLREAADLAKDTPFPRVALGELLLRQGRADQALTELQAANLVAGTARGFLATGDAFATRMELDRARTFYRDAASQPLLPQGAVLAAGEVDPFEAPFAPDPRAAARCRLAALDLAAGNIEQARAQYGDAQAIDPFSPDAEAGLARIDLREANLPLCEARLSRAYGLLARIDGAEAEVVRSPAAGRVLIVKGAFLIEHGRHQEASEVLSLAAQVDPGLAPQASTLLGRMFEATSQPRRAYDAYTDAARTEVQESVPGGREFAAAQRRFAEGGAEPAQLQRVLDGLTAALAENPYLARAYLLRGQVLIAMKKPRDALVELERAVVVNKYLRDAYIVRGFCYVRDLPEREQTRETTALAQEAFQTALLIEQRQGGERAETHTGLAQVLFLQNDLLPAHKAADRAVELDADYAEAYRVRAMIRARQGNAAGAQQDQKKHDELKKRPS